MPFQGIKLDGPDPLSLALAIRRMRMEEEQAQEESRIARIKALSDAEANRAKMAMEAARFEHDKRVWASEQEGMDDKSTARLAEPLSIVLDPSATQSEQSMAAQSYLPQLMDRAKKLDPTGGADLGRYLNQAGIDAGGMVASSMAGERKAGEAKRSDLEIQDEFARRREAREEARQIAQERSTEAAKERAAENGGVWEPKDLNTYRRDREKDLSFVFDTAKDWRRLNTLKADDPQDTFELIQRWQRRVDQGATVREGDIQMVTSVGASGVDQLQSAAKAFFDQNKKFPPGFGQKLKSSLEGMLVTEDEKAVDIASGIEDFAEQNGWGDRELRIAMPYRKQINEARDRISKRVPAVGASSYVPAGFKPHPTIPGLYINDKGEGFVP